ncbi:hypothetical protein EJB05_15924, partial [Eragrostis curvula]
MAYKKLRQLTISKQVGWEIKVKIIRMWRSINNVTDELISLDMILMDEQGETIRATIWSNLIESYESKIIEGSVYALSNFKVQEDSKYRPVKNTLTIVFMYNTNIKEVEEQSEELSNEEENVPKLMEIDKSTQGTEEEQMFYNRKTLLDITQMRHHSPIDKDFVFTTKATIDQLKENTAWWYMSCDGCNKMCNTIQNKYYCSRCNKNPETITARYWIRFQISDHTTTTTCTIFDNEAQRLLKINVTSLLDSLDGKSEDVPKLIQQLYGKTFIFRFKLNNENLTEGKPNYLVKRTFIPNDALELRYSNDQTEEEPMKNDSTGRLEDGDVENNTSSECIGAKQRKRKRKRVEDDSDKDCVEIDDPRKSNYKHQKGAARQRQKKEPNVVALEKTLATAARVKKKFDELEKKFLNGQVDDDAKQTNKFGKRKKQRSVSKEKEAKLPKHYTKQSSPECQTEETRLDQKRRADKKVIDLTKRIEPKMVKDRSKKSKKSISQRKRKNREEVTDPSTTQGGDLLQREENISNNEKSRVQEEKQDTTLEVQSTVEESVHDESGNNSNVKDRSKKSKRVFLKERGRIERRVVISFREKQTFQTMRVQEQQQDTTLEVQSTVEESIHAESGNNSKIDGSNEGKKKIKSQKSKKRKLTSKGTQKDEERCIYDAPEQHVHSNQIGCEEEDINKSGSDDEYKEKDTVPVQKKDLPARCKSTRARRTPARYMT